MKGIVILFALLLSVGGLACEGLVEEPTPASIPTQAAKPTARTSSTPRPSGPQLALISASCTHDTWMKCEGFVKNISGKSLENIEVVILWYDDTGTPVSSDTALIDYDPILAGQQSPWDTFGNYNPAITKFRVEFKEFFGGTIPYRDDRPD